MSRYARKVDDNHAEVVAALRAAGAFVWSLASAGNGTPDLLVWFRGAYYLLEVKDGRKPPSARALTPAESAFIKACPGKVHVVLCAEDALAAIGASRRAA